MHITHRDQQDFKDDKLVAKERKHIPLFAQVTQLFLCVQGRCLAGFDLIYHQLRLIGCFMNISLYIELPSNLVTVCS